MPPAFSQSAWLWIVDSGEPLPDAPPVVGLADGDEPDDDGDDVDPLLGDPLLEPEPPAPVPPELLGPLLPPALLPPLLEPPPVCAVASAGARQTSPINTRESIFFISHFLLRSESEARPADSWREQYPGPRRRTLQRGVAGEVIAAGRSITRKATSPRMVAAIAAAAKRTGVAGSCVTSRSNPASGCTPAITT